MNNNITTAATTSSSPEVLNKVCYIEKYKTKAVSFKRNDYLCVTLFYANGIHYFITDNNKELVLYTVCKGDTSGLIPERATHREVLLFIQRNSVSPYAFLNIRKVLQV